MSKWKIAAIVLAAAIYAVSLSACGERFGTYHFRLTIEVDTPDGVRRGSSVLAVTYGRGPRWAQGIGGGSAYARLRGEAVFVELADGRGVVALLAHGSEGYDVNSIGWLPITAFTGAPLGWGSIDALAALRARGKYLEGVTELKNLLVPTFIASLDVRDPKKTYRLNNSEFVYIFGKGYAFGRAALEIVPAGIWPFNLLPVPWFSWLFGVPPTVGIERKLPMLQGPNRPALAALESAGMQTGYQIDAESAFKRR